VLCWSSSARHDLTSMPNALAISADHSCGERSGHGAAGRLDRVSVMQLGIWAVGPSHQAAKGKGGRVMAGLVIAGCRVGQALPGHAVPGQALCCRPTRLLGCSRRQRPCVMTAVQPLVSVPGAPVSVTSALLLGCTMISERCTMPAASPSTGPPRFWLLEAGSPRMMSLVL
jgi:hypothetical protein